MCLMLMIAIPPDGEHFTDPAKDNNHKHQEPQTVTSKYTVTVTAYSSARRETDDTPKITANGTLAKDGIIAANFLPFGTKVKIPELFGEKTFVVADRMHPRKKFCVDVWMPSSKNAKKFGRHEAITLIVSQKS